MRKYLLASIIALVSTAAFAQDYEEFDIPSDRAHWSVRVAWDYTIPGDWTFSNGNSVSMYRNGSGLSAGVSYNLPFGKSFYFEPGVNFYYNTYSYDDVIFTDIDENGNIREIKDPDIEKTGFRIPLHVGVRFPVFTTGNIALFTGPMPCIGTSANVDLNKYAAEIFDFPTNLYESGEQRRFDLAWNVGAAMMFGSWQIDITGSFGLLDLHPNDSRYRENRLTIGLAYNF